MDGTYIIVILALLSLLGFTIFALVGKKRIEDRLRSSDAPKSTLASDKKDDGKPADV
ncbi:hypothetical protein [Sulfitobacter sabulilitoris]|uniref:hypothetical protein n=1 Tax=Sulfitobacter sabulilitoris TaxID=2562655 RepID=UPI0014792713|nr:hypothetical protein [Sulfitobacter sabulilitoris]